MQITSLYIEDYKLLKKFNINFSKDVSILIGVNGSGKSTILETIAQIFSDAYLGEKSKFGFKITYELRVEEILEQTTTSAEFKTDYLKVEISTNKKDEILTYKIFDTPKTINEITSLYGSFEKILPSNVVIYYSGFAEIMKQICLPHDNNLSVNYRKGNAILNRPFFYFEPDLFNLVLITLLSYEFGDIPIFLEERAKIKGLQSVTISIKKPSWGKGNADDW